MAEFLSDPKIVEQFQRIVSEMPFQLWETVYSTLLSTLFAYLLGLPLGILLVAGERDGVMPLPRPVMSVLNVAVNILRSIPFLILMIMVMPLSRVLIGTSVGTKATIVPLVAAAFPYVARLVESSLREIDRGVVEAAQAMGASPFQIIRKVMLPESLPSLITGFTIALTTILSYGAMSGAIGGGGLGSMAINLGFQRRQWVVLYASVILLVLLVQIVQTAGTWLSVRLDKRNSKQAKRKKKPQNPTASI